MDPKTVYWLMFGWVWVLLMIYVLFVVEKKVPMSRYLPTLSKLYVAFLVSTFFQFCLFPFWLLFYWSIS